MKILYEKPPVYDRIVKAIGTPPEGAIFTYGDTIFVPSGKTPPGDLQHHESIHYEQQICAGGAMSWWARYLKDPQWRVEQELEAYRAQLAFVTKRSPRKRAAALEDMAKAMSSPMYGNVITFDDAWKAIGGYA